ncbi:MAG: hypothetical protein JWM27_1532 [Gemmatimonadetes bacterium]|nr:hypothetical protein [Gemmatimonadota bacterium]
MYVPQLKPLSFGEILDGAFTLYRRHFSTLVVTALLPQIPVVGLQILQASVRPDGAGLLVVGLVGLLAIPAYLASYALCRGALVQEASSAYLGQPVSRSAAFTVARKRFWAILGTGILAWLAILIGFCLFGVPGILLSIMFFASDIVAVLEGTAGPAALARSRELARGAWLRISGIWMMLVIIIYMPIIALGIGGVLAAPRFTSGMSPETSRLVVAGIQVGGALLGALVQPLVVLGMTLLYYDRRVRTEALDLVDATAAAPAFA